MSKQLTLSAALSILAMAAFTMLVAPHSGPANEKGATTTVAAPSFEASLPGR